MIQINLLMKQRLTATQNTPVVARKGGGGRRREGLGVWGYQRQMIIYRIDKHKNYCTEQVTIFNKLR